MNAPVPQAEVTLAELRAIAWADLGYRVTNRSAAPIGRLVAATRIADGAAVWLWAADDRAGAEREIAVAASLAASGAVLTPLALESSGDGELLLVYLRATEQPLTALAPLTKPLVFAEAACALAVALEKLHAGGVVHQDIRPAHIVLDLHSMRARYCGLRHASPLTYGSLPAAPVVDESRLPYIAPEQTLRMAAGVDYRSDLYALGISLFVLACARLPFEAADALGWAHAHLALAPAPLAVAAPTLPAVLCEIVAKLLTKAPEERY